MAETNDDPKIVVSSSPLKTLSSAATNPPQALQSIMSAYIHKYCEVVTGGRVVFQGLHSFAASPTGGWYRFKCKTCQDNWNMKTDLFYGTNSCPKELQDWLDLHKHVCTKFGNAQYNNANPRCGHCGWAWNQHKEAQPQYDIATGQWEHAAFPAAGPIQPGEKVIPLYQGRTTGTRPCIVCEEVIAVASGSSVCDECYRAAKQVRATKALTVTTTQGRMFRNIKESACESLKVINPTNSPDSANSTTSASKD